MKTKIMLSVAFATLAFCSCQKENSMSGSAKVFRACIDEATKTTLVDTVVVWEDNDQISINSKVYQAVKGGSSTASFTAVAGEAEANAEGAAYKAFYPASIANMTFPSVQTYGELRNNPMYAESSNQDLSFKNLGSLLEFRIKGTKTVKTILMTSSNASFSGTFTIEPDGNGFKAVTGTTKKGVVLDCGTGVALTAEGTAFRVAVPAMAIEKLKVVITATDGATFEKTASSTITTVRSHIQPINIDASEFTPIELPGVFTVNASGKTVKFSRGLLYWEGLQDAFQVEPNQYFSVPAELDGAQGNKYAGYEGGAHISFFPFTSIVANAKTKYYYAPADVNQVHFAYNGGAIAGWTILTADEWSYLMNSRTVNGGTGQGKSYVCCNTKTRKTIDGKAFSGVFVYPDNYAGSYDETTWAAVNAAGIVYLPANGFYGSNNTPKGNGYISNLKGRFMYPSPTLTKSGETYNTKIMNYQDNALSFGDKPAAIGCSIRLVKVQ